MAFLEGVSGIAFDGEQNHHVQFASCISIESIYYLRNFNIVLPYSFLKISLQSRISGSKTVTTVNGKLHPSGSYPVIQRWLEGQGSDPIDSLCGDLITFFDNIGKYVIDNYRVNYKKSKSADIISTVLQKPVYWSRNRTESQIQQLMEDFLNSCLINFQKHRYHYPSEMLNQVRSED